MKKIFAVVLISFGLMSCSDSQFENQTEAVNAYESLTGSEFKDKIDWLEKSQNILKDTTIQITNRDFVMYYCSVGSYLPTSSPHYQSLINRLSFKNAYREETEESRLIINFLDGYWKLSAPKSIKDLFEKDIDKVYEELISAKHWIKFDSIRSEGRKLYVFKGLWNDFEKTKSAKLSEYEEKLSLIDDGEKFNLIRDSLYRLDFYPRFIVYKRYHPTLREFIKTPPMEGIKKLDEYSSYVCSLYTKEIFKTKNLVVLDSLTNDFNEVSHDTEEYSVKISTYLKNIIIKDTKYSFEDYLDILNKVYDERDLFLSTIEDMEEEETYKICLNLLSKSRNDKHLASILEFAGQNLHENSGFLQLVKMKVKKRV